MSHAEIWDDSALVESWNEALEEYKARNPLRSLHQLADCQIAVPQHIRSRRKSRGCIEGSRERKQRTVSQASLRWIRRLTKLFSGRAIDYEDEEVTDRLNDAHAKNSLPEEGADHGSMPHGKEHRVSRSRSKYNYQD